MPWKFLMSIFMLCIAKSMYALPNAFVVSDSLTRQPLVNASIFDKKGRFIGTSDSKGVVRCTTSSDYPITLRYMGYHERTMNSESIDTIFLTENISELPEVVVEGRHTKVVHILAYVREYSTLSTYTDTIHMFREKMVDFMLPSDPKSRFRGWSHPRPLKIKSYYHFTNANGLDSVSDRCNQYFSWSDWIGMIPTIKIPSRISSKETCVDTIFGKYSPTEIWKKSGDKFTININVLADSHGRRWVPNLSHFFNKEDTEFEHLRLKINYDDVIGNEVSPRDLNRYSFNIESRGRGRKMFQFNRVDEPFFVNTYVEVYILDKEFISVKDAKKWEKRDFTSEDIQIFEPSDAPELQPPTLALIDRVNQIDSIQVRLSLKPDLRLMSRNVSKRNFQIGYRALNLLKQLTGITLYRSHRNFNKNWDNFKKGNRNQQHSGG